jgi:hypothetical protein
MWMQATLSTEDLTRALESLCPARIDLADDRWIDLARPRSVTLIPDLGLRVLFEARVRWSLIGIDVPVTVNEVELLLAPKVVPKGDSSVIAFEMQVGALDLKFVPAPIDGTVADRINAALVEARPSMVWDFRKTLDFTFELPAALSPAEKARLHAKWAEMKVTAEAVSLAVSFELDVARTRVVG